MQTTEWRAQTANQHNMTHFRISQLACKTAAKSPFHCSESSTGNHPTLHCHHNALPRSTTTAKPRSGHAVCAYSPLHPPLRPLAAVLVPVHQDLGRGRGVAAAAAPCAPGVHAARPWSSPASAAIQHAAASPGEPFQRLHRHTPHRPRPGAGRVTAARMHASTTTTPQAAALCRLATAAGRRIIARALLPQLQPRRCAHLHQLGHLGADALVERLKLPATKRGAACTRGRGGWRGAGREGGREEKGGHSS